MARNSFTAFISSTSEDLGPYRRAAGEVVLDAGWVPVMMEHFPASSEPIVTFCQNRIREVDLVLLLQAFRKGGVPSVSQGGDGETSFTGFELKAADALQKPVLAFLADGKRWPGALFEDDAASRAWVRNFRNSVNRNAKFFPPEEGDLNSFKALIREAITRHKEELIGYQTVARPLSEGAPDSRGLPPLRVVPDGELPDEPYPLLLPYTHPDTFAGRDAALEKLELLLRRPQLVLCLHAPSGAGKSSLLDAGLVPRLRRRGCPVSIDRRPGEPGLAQRLVADLLELPQSFQTADPEASQHVEFIRWIEHAANLSGHTPILILDQLDDLMRHHESRDAALARLGPLLAATARRAPAGRGFCCRWVLSYRHEFHGEVMEWMRDVLTQARREAPSPVLDELPHDLSEGDRLQSWPVPLLGAGQPGDDGYELSKRDFLSAIQRPLWLKYADGRARYRIKFEDEGEERLAAAFARARVRQPGAPLAPELQVVLQHLIQAAVGGHDRTQVVSVPTDSVALERLIDDALVEHLRRALQSAYPSVRSPMPAKQGRARALLALRELADETGNRANGLSRDELVAIIGPDGNLVLDTLASPAMRLVVEEPRGDSVVCMLSHDRLADVILQSTAGQGESATLGVDRDVVELRSWIVLRSRLYARKDSSALALTPQQYSLISDNTGALVRSDAEKQWWKRSDAWFTLSEGLRRDAKSALHVLEKLTDQHDEDWTPLLKSAGVSADVFWRCWAPDHQPDPANVLKIVERTYAAFLSPTPMFRAVSYAAEEALRRSPELAASVNGLRVRMRADFTQLTRGSDRKPFFRGDRWHLPDEPLLGFVKIAAGPFIMGTSNANPVATSDEFWPTTELDESGLGGRVELQDFYVGRHPVTVSQFRAFVEATGVGKDIPSVLTGYPQEPVTQVSWHEALEYCGWLERELATLSDVPIEIEQALASGWRVTFPSEAEWEKSARGVDGRTYPWGEFLDPGLANFDEARLLGTSMVGAFPRGASPYGILDLSGNVWEWTRSIRKPYPYVLDDGREDLKSPGPRVLRGGAFYNRRKMIRASGRSAASPESRRNSCGFRLALTALRYAPSERIGPVRPEK